MSDPEPQSPGPPAAPASARTKRRLGRWLRAQWDAFSLPVDEHTDFPENRGQLRSMLATDDTELAKEMLEEAEAAYQRMTDRVEGAERRATTLQGAAAIAAGLTLTGSGLLLDASKLRGWGWQLAFGALLVYVTFALVLCAYRATLATSRVHTWVASPDRAVLSRPGQTVAQARTERTAEVLLALGGNQRIARWKVAMMRAAAEWLTRALLALLAVAVLASVYVVVGPESTTTTTGTSARPPATATPARPAPAGVTTTSARAPQRTAPATPKRTSTPTRSSRRPVAPEPRASPSATP